MEAKEKPKHILHDYMLDTVNRIAIESKRAEERSDKAIQLFIGLLTAFFGGNVAVSTAVQDVSSKHWILSISLLIMAGIGLLTYMWILGANVLRHTFAMERYHLDMYFRDLDPVSYDKYGQTLYSLDIHYGAVKNGSGFASSLPLYLSIAALAVFNGVTFGASVYIAWLELTAASNSVVSIASGLMLIVALGIFWYLSEKTISKKRSESQQLLKKYKLDKTHD